jgi:hypothetical protein
MDGYYSSEIHQKVVVVTFVPSLGSGSARSQIEPPSGPLDSPIRSLLRQGHSRLTNYIARRREEGHGRFAAILGSSASQTPLLEVVNNCSPNGDITWALRAPAGKRPKAKPPPSSQYRERSAVVAHPPEPLISAATRNRCLRSARRPTTTCLPPTSAVRSASSPGRRRPPLSSTDLQSSSKSIPSHSRNRPSTKLLCQPVISELEWFQ